MRRLLLFLCCIAVASVVHADVAVFNDPFTAAATATTTNVNDNVPARQTGASLTGTYTELPTSSSGGTNDSYIDKNSVAFASDGLLLRAFHGSGSSQDAVRLSTDFGPSVAGKRWRVSFTGNIQRTSTDITDTWLSLDLGDTAGHIGPNNASTDFGLLIRGSGGWQVFLDNVNTASSSTNLRSPDLYATNYRFTVTFDETVSPVTATAQVTVDGTTTILGTWPMTWENASRFIELRIHNSGNANSVGTVCDGRIDDLVVSLTGDPAAAPVITSAPQPQSVWTGEGIALRVAADSWNTPTYQWYKDGAPISGANSATYTVPQASSGDSGTYTVKITNSNGTVSADVAVDVTYPNRWQQTAEPIGPSSRRSGLVISEVMYHPATRADGRNTEFVELYNSNPWVEDLSGWRLSGEVEFAFPAGTSIAALGRLVIAASPSDVQTAYGISGVLGPWTGALNNAGGTVRLRKKSGAIVLEAKYANSPAWPAQADGAGHSLVLARPSYGEGNALAWAPSLAIGGSPGAAEATPATPLDHVLFNEVLANAASGGKFVELFNSSLSTVDLSGCWISNNAAQLQLFQIPAGTVIPARGFVSFTDAQLGFSPKPEGDTLFLTDAAGVRVADALRYRAQNPGIASGRIPNGEGDFLPISAPTPGAANATAARGPVVINEIFFHPPTNDSRDEFVELKNITSAEVDLSGWKFTDGLGGFILPAGTKIAAGSYLVVAKDPVQLQAKHPGLSSGVVVGGWSGSLSDSGAELALGRPTTISTGATIYGEVDRVAYVDQSRWSQWADGGGSSLELADPRARGRSAWLDSDESTKAPWTTVSTTGTLDLGYGSTWLPDRVQCFMMGNGEALVDNIAVNSNGGANLVSNGTFDASASGWTFQGNTIRSAHAPGRGVGGTGAMLLRSTERGDPAGNRAFAVLSSAPPVNQTGTISAQARWLRGSPEFLLRLKGGWLETLQSLTVPGNLGTPGAANSRAVANASPDITDVQHRPLLPTAGVPIRVFARVADPDGLATVTLKWRLDPSATLASVAMNDDGLNGDLLAGDGIFTGVIPAQSANALVAFRVEATDSQAAVAVFPPTAPASECLVRVGDPAQSGAIGRYRMWMTSATVSTWAGRGKFANEPLDVTLIHGDARAVYGVSAYYSGSEATTPGYNSPVGNLCGFNLLLPADDRIMAEDHLIFDWPVRDVTDQREMLMFWMLEQLGMPNLYRRHVHLFVNGIRRGTIADDIQQPGKDILNEFFPNDANGTLFKTSNWYECDDAANTYVSPSIGNELKHFDSAGQHKLARYRWSWRPRAAGTQNDFTALFALIDSVNATGNYEAGVRSNVDVDSWMRQFAFNDLVAYWDSFGNPNHKNTYLYRPTSSPWIQLNWDMDVGLGVFNDPTNYALFPTGIDPALNTMMNYPAFRRQYWRLLDEALGSFFSGSAVTPRLTAIYNGLVANGVGVTSPLVASGPYNLSVPGWIDQRRTFLQNEIANAGAYTAFAVNGPQSFSTSASPITVTGAAPVTVKAITFNGLELPVTWTDMTHWSAQVSVVSGTHPLVVTAVDGNGATVGTTTLTITYTGVTQWPALRINEWMASNTGAALDPADGHADDWLELYNPTNAPVNLANWILSDSSPSPTSYVIPSGYVIPAGGRLLVWADGETIQNTGSGQLHVSFKLGAGGEVLTLRAPDGTVVDTVTFGQQVDNVSQGRVPDGGTAIDFLSTASAGTANSTALAAPSATTAVSGSVITITVASTSGFSYQLQAKEELTDSNWVSIGTGQTATGASVTFQDNFGARTRRFYRVVRTP